MSGLLEARDLRKSYSRATGLLATDGHGADFMAVDGVSFSVEAGRLLLWSGKAGAARLRLRECCCGLSSRIRAKSNSTDKIADAQREKLRRQRRQMQMIFQDPFASLNRGCAWANRGEPLAIHEPELSRMERRERVGSR